MIRRLRHDDGPAMKEIDGPDHAAGDFTRLVAKQAFAGLADEDEGVMRGYITGWSVEEDGEVIQISVHPDHRRRGIGEGLLARFMADFAARSCHLEVRSDNFAARELYRKAGFVEVGRRKGYYHGSGARGGPGRVDAILMRATPRPD